MATKTRSRQSAKRATLAVQVLSVVMIVGVVASAFALKLGVPKGDAGAGAVALDPGDVGDTPAQPERVEYAARHDPEMVAINFSMFDNAPIEDPADEIDEVQTPVEPEPEALGVRYVGSIKVGGRAAAFMNIGGVTKLLRPGGAAYEGVRLVRVEGGEVVVSIDDGPERSIEKTARTGPAVSLVTGGAPEAVKSASAVAGESPDPRDPDSDMTREERRAALLERAQRERERWERRRGDGGGPPN